MGRKIYFGAVIIPGWPSQEKSMCGKHWYLWVYILIFPVRVLVCVHLYQSRTSRSWYTLRVSQRRVCWCPTPSQTWESLCPTRSDWPPSPPTTLGTTSVASYSTQSVSLPLNMHYFLKESPFISMDWHTLCVHIWLLIAIVFLQPTPIHVLRVRVSF